MLERYSISAKLFAIVAFLVLVIAMIGSLAFVQMGAINAATQDIQTRWLPSVRWIGEMRVQSARYRAVLRDHLIVADADRPDVDKNLSARKADFEKGRQGVRATGNGAGGTRTRQHARRAMERVHRGFGSGAGSRDQG